MKRNPTVILVSAGLALGLAAGTVWAQGKPTRSQAADDRPGSRRAGARRAAAARLRHRPGRRAASQLLAREGGLVRSDGEARRDDLAAAAERRQGGRPDARAAPPRRDRGRQEVLPGRPDVTIIIKTINSRKVFITGSVAKPGPYPLTSATTVLQLISMAGGLTEFAKQKNISVMRTENGKPVRYRVQLQGRRQRQEPEAEHRAEARGYGHCAVGQGQWTVVVVSGQ